MDVNDLDRKQVRRAFERAADSYDQAAVVQRALVDELMDRLAMIKLDPARMLDVGCGTGYARSLLMKRFPKARYFGSDISLAMLRKARPRGWRWRRAGHWLGADVERLPLADQCLDLVFCSAVLQWCDPVTAFRELHRVLRPEGLLMFATFGPDTLRELREVWAQVDSSVHVHEFLDMHHLGDALVDAGFQLPVVDMDYLTVTHRRVIDCLKDIKAVGAGNAAGARGRGLMPRGRLRALERAYEARRNADGLIETSYELVYGHAWAGELRQSSQEDGSVAVPLSQLKRRS